MMSLDMAVKVLDESISQVVLINSKEQKQLEVLYLVLTNT